MRSDAPMLVSADVYGWLQERLAQSTEGATYLGQILPAGYERYLRVFDPWTPAEADYPVRRWEDAAREAGVEFYPEIVYSEIASVVRRPVAREDLFVDAHPPTRQRVIARLEQAATGPWYFAWELGAGIALTESPVVVQSLSLDPHRAYSPLQALERQPHPINAGTPEHWWPENRSWVVSEEYDLEELYLACGSQVAEALLRDSELEVVEVGLTSRVDWIVDDDRRNPR